MMPFRYPTPPLRGKALVKAAKRRRHDLLHARPLRRERRRMIVGLWRLGHLARVRESLRSAL